MGHWLHFSSYSFLSPSSSLRVLRIAELFRLLPSRFLSYHSTLPYNHTDPTPTDTATLQNTSRTFLGLPGFLVWLGSFSFYHPDILHLHVSAFSAFPHFLLHTSRSLRTAFNLIPSFPHSLLPLPFISGLQDSDPTRVFIIGIPAAVDSSAAVCAFLAILQQP